MQRTSAIAFGTMAILVLGACARVKAAIGRDAPPSGTTTSSAASSSPSAADTGRTAPSAAAKAGCAPATVGGTALGGGKLSPANTTIAAAHGKALVLNTFYSRPRLNGLDDLTDAASTEWVTLGPSGLPEAGFAEVHAMKPPAPPAGGIPLMVRWMFGAATSFEGELTTLTYWAVALDVIGNGCEDGKMSLKSGSSAPVWMASDFCKASSVLAGAARGDFAIAVIDGISRVEPATSTGIPSADTLHVIVHAAKKTKVVRLETFEDLGQHVDALAAAVGDTVGAAAYRTMGPQAKEIRIARVDRKGAKLGKTLTLDKGLVGAPALAFVGDDLHVVWASRTNAKEPYSLRWTKWPRDGSPEPTHTISTGASSFAPGLAIEGGRFLLAWTDGDEKTGTVKAGVSTKGLDAAAAAAAVMSSANVNARDPEVAADKGNIMFVVWHELGPKKKEIRATTLKCTEE